MCNSVTKGQQLPLQFVHLMMASLAEICSVPIKGRGEYFWSVNFNASTKFHRNGEKCEGSFSFQIILSEDYKLLSFWLYNFVLLLAPSYSLVPHI
jgi:hypothetical protein